MTACLSACGDDQGNSQLYPGSPAGSEQNGGVQGSVPASGFSEQMVSSAGFRLGIDKPADIIAKFGQPTGSDRAEYSNETVVTLNYDFGSFQFDSGSGDDSTLFYIEINGNVPGPNGVSVGMDIKTAADTIYAGSGDIIYSTAESEVFFYGSSETVSSYGKYTCLADEFSSDIGVYELEYSTIHSGSSRQIYLVLSFDANKMMTLYTVQMM